jgi:membrane-bound metal-dependent hydrolase YbcI (DUF457 family)
VDNLAHSLVGAALGRAVADDKVRAAGWIGAVAANAPDWSEFLIGFRPDRGSGAYYLVHRGITHSFLGAAVETVAITAVAWGILALWRRSTPIALGRLFLLVAVTVASHVYMDWQGSYGLRPFLPWSAHWYYADWVAIVDPVFWLVPLVGLAWGAERHWRDLIPVVLIAALVTWVVLNADGVATWLRATCVITIAVGGVGWIRHWFGVVGRRRAAAWSLVAVGLYAVAQVVASVPAKASVRRAAIARFGAGAEWAALTRVRTPFEWEPILASRDTVAGPTWAIPRHLDDPLVQRALTESSDARALASFARFLAAEVDSGPRGVVVTFRDARYARPPSLCQRARAPRPVDG